jgi:hypothetical protein
MEWMRWKGGRLGTGAFDLDITELTETTIKPMVPVETAIAAFFTPCRMEANMERSYIASGRKGEKCVRAGRNRLFCL